jgi:hypothetical protein
VIHDVINSLVNTNPQLTTIIDVGCGESLEIERWSVLNKTVFDFWYTPKLMNIECIHGDLTTYNFGTRKWDVVVCSQVLEHISKVEIAISNLFSISNNYVIISLPYLWPVGKELGHVHDPIDHLKLHEWFDPIKHHWEITKSIFCDKQTRIICVFKHKFCL